MHPHGHRRPPATAKEMRCTQSCTARHTAPDAAAPRCTTGHRTTEQQRRDRPERKGTAPDRTARPHRRVHACAASCAGERPTLYLPPHTKSGLPYTSPYKSALSQQTTHHCLGILGSGEAGGHFYGESGLPYSSPIQKAAYPILAPYKRRPTLDLPHIKSPPAARSSPTPLDFWVSVVLGDVCTGKAAYPIVLSYKIEPTLYLASAQYSLPRTLVSRPSPPP
jgi:hypothetical protein